MFNKTYHSVWKQSSVLDIPILTRKFLTKSSTISGLWLNESNLSDYYDYQLGKFGDQVLMFNLCCCDWLHFLWQVVGQCYWHIIKHAKLQASILLTMEMRKVAHGNSVILNLSKTLSHLTQDQLITIVKL